MRVITERVVGYWPLSIATSLAIESLVGVGMDEFGQEKRTPNRTGEFDVLWINLRTLIRNCVDSIDHTPPGQLQASDISATVYEELQHIRQILSDLGPHLELQPYWCGYEDLPRLYPHAELREPSTIKQRELAEVTARASKGLIASVAADLTIGGLRRFRTIIDRGSLVRCCMLTHMPIDLISQPLWRRLTLLESHTGAFKGPNEWWTKFTSSMATAQIPFDAAMLQVFGDPETFKPAALRVRRAVHECAQTNRWSYLTSEGRMRDNFKRITSESERQFLLSLLSTR